MIKVGCHYFDHNMMLLLHTKKEIGLQIEEKKGAKFSPHVKNNYLIESILKKIIETIIFYKWICLCQRFCYYFVDQTDQCYIFRKEKNK